MISNYLKIALRTLGRHKGYSILNIAGLSIGIAACIVMLLYVQDEFTYDRFNTKADRMYRLVETGRSADQGIRHFPFAMGPIGKAMVDQYPNVLQAVRMRDRGGLGRFTVSYKDRRFYEGSYIAADPEFFSVFDFTFLQGDPGTALSEPNSVVLTEAAARKYFGDENPVGKTLRVERIGDSKVTGLLKDPPANSHLQFSMVFSLITMQGNEGWKRYMGSWDSDGFITYLVTAPGVSTDVVNRELTALVNEHRASLDKDLVSVYAQPLLDIHFGSGAMEFDRNSGKRDRTSVLAFAAIGLMILLIACINYVNLATARGMKRAREVGMRKVTGAYRWQLLLQLLGESVLLSAFGLVCALLIVETLLPGFNSLAGKSLELHVVGNPDALLALVILVLVVGILSGIYPAMMLARLNPVAALKQQGSSHSSAGALRRVLVVIQFALTIVMIVATVVAHRQIEFVHARNLGFDKDHLLVVDINNGNTRRSFETIKRQIARLPDVRNVCVSSRVPGEWKNISEVKVLPASGPSDQTHTMHFICIDQDFLNTFKIHLIAGRNFSGNLAADTSSVILNEAAVRTLGWTDPIGREMIAPASGYRARVIGVVRDFNFRSLHEPVGPLVLGHWDNPITNIDYFSVRFRTADIGGMLASLGKIHDKFDTVSPMEYNFLDERIEDFYRNDERTQTILTLAAGLAIIVAALGLLGLVSFVTEQRTKEIGVRKVLGASARDIVFLLWKDLVLLVAIATAVGSPIAYLALQGWLQNFAYHIQMQWWSFIGAGVIALLVALATAGIQTMRAASANPVESLKYE